MDGNVLAEHCVDQGSAWLRKGAQSGEAGLAIALLAVSRDAKRPRVQGSGVSAPHIGNLKFPDSSGLLPLTTEVVKRPIPEDQAAARPTWAASPPVANDVTAPGWRGQNEVQLIWGRVSDVDRDPRRFHPAIARYRQR